MLLFLKSDLFLAKSHSSIGGFLCVEVGGDVGWKQMFRWFNQDLA